MYRRKTRVDLLPGDLSYLRIEYLFLSIVCQAMSIDLSFGHIVCIADLHLNKLLYVQDTSTLQHLWKMSTGEVLDFEAGVVCLAM